MTSLLAYITMLVQLLLAMSRARADEGCTPWFIPKGSDGANCTCGSSLNGIVSCPDEQFGKLQLTDCYCMTSGRSNETVVGGCRYSCVARGSWYSDPAELDYHMCSELWKRTGVLCSKCMDGFGPLVYSYEIQCIPCPSKQPVLLFLASFLLLSVFCLTVMILRVSIARPPMSTFVLVSQFNALPTILQYAYLPVSHKKVRLFNRNAHNTAWRLFSGFYGLWNLDILRSFYPQICLSPHMTTLHAVLLEYLIAIFPLLMVLLAYYSVKLYDRGNRAIFWVCRPVHTCLARLRRSIDIRSSLVDAFATFIILSVNKVIFTSSFILQPLYVYSPYGNRSVFVYLDPTMEYFGWHHLPYALIAFLFSFFLILVPLLLLFLYPSRRFQTFLNNRGWQCHLLHVFADSFQGCYKDGTGGTRDYRWFAGLGILIRCTTVFPLELSRYHHHLNYLFMVVGVAFYMALLAITQPYKKQAHLKQDMILLFGLLLWYAALLDGALLDRGSDLVDRVLHLILAGVGSLIPLLYIAGLMLHWLLVVKKVHIWVLKKIRFTHFSSDQIRLLDHSA